MKSPGKLLREAREERGLTLGDVAAMTRIPRGMLEHLEQDRYEEYVAEVFLRGHLRNYAQELHLNVDEVLQAYERHTGRHRRNPLSDTVPGETAPAPTRLRMSGASASAVDVRRWTGNFRRSHFVAAFLVVAGVFLLFSYLSNNRATAQDPAEYQEAEGANWEVDQSVEETRWLLERTDR